jgi:hypothetical protein
LAFHLLNAGMAFGAEGAEIAVGECEADLLDQGDNVMDIAHWLRPILVLVEWIAADGIRNAEVVAHYLPLAAVPNPLGSAKRRTIRSNRLVICIRVNTTTGLAGLGKTATSRMDAGLGRAGGHGSARTNRVLFGAGGGTGCGVGQRSDEEVDESSPLLEMRLGVKVEDVTLRGGEPEVRHLRWVWFSGGSHLGYSPNTRRELSKAFCFTQLKRKTPLQFRGAGQMQTG